MIDTVRYDLDTILSMPKGGATVRKCLNLEILLFTNLIKSTLLKGAHRALCDNWAQIGYFGHKWTNKI